MILRSSLSIAVLFNIILQVSSMKDVNNKIGGSDALKQEDNFYKLLEATQHENEHARHLLHIKKSLNSRGKSLPPALYKRMKMRVLKSLQEDMIIRRRTLQDENAQKFEAVKCGLRLTPVEVPYPKAGFSYPPYILMHRCVGGCFYKTPDVFHCVTKNASIVQVKTIEYNTETGDFNDKKVEQVKNDTECDCECIVQEHHCDKETEIYNPDTCQCDCRDLSHTCNAILKVWDMTKCGCKCREDPYPCNDNSKLWSQDTCDCQCLTSIKKRCARKNKLLNPEKCECYCSPDIKCPVGSKLRNYDCSCVQTR